MPYLHLSVTTFVYVILISGEGQSLSCYKCTNEKTNIHCIDDYNLQLCGQGMDTCQTITSYSDVSEKLSILKSCTTNVSCHLQKQQYDNSCHFVSPDWICVYCCQHDKCNIHVASGTASPWRTRSLFSQILDYVLPLIFFCVEMYFAFVP